MEIRTITVGAREEDLGKVALAAQRARTRLELAGYRVQTLRLALSLVSNRCGDLVSIARGVEQSALDAGFEYVSLGPLDARLSQLPDAIAATQWVFASAQMLGSDGGLRRDVIAAAADAIVAIAAATPNGFGNLRFAALANIAPGAPFFPSAFHDAGEPWLAVGPESAALAVQAVDEQQRAVHEEQRTGTLGLSLAAERALPYLTTLIEQHDAQISAALAGFESETGVRFTGCDWSLAPRPGPSCSIGAAIEALSGVPFGSWGTLAAIRGLTTAVRQAQVHQLGFSGVMLPVIEDSTLAQRSIEGRYTLRDLLAFSAVCGTGLDTVPLPGDISSSQIAGVLLEVAALSAALHKPLTARLMPMPGLQPGAMTTLMLSGNPQFATYFCAARAISL